MTPAEETIRFNQLLDITMGLVPAQELAARGADPDVDELLEVAARLAAVDFRDELRGSVVPGRSEARVARLAPAQLRAAPWRMRAAVLLTILALLATALLVVGPERASAALRRLLGYIPGVGLVDDRGGLRVLAEPVRQTRQGITVTIAEVIVDSERTVIVYTTEGLTIAAANSRGEGGPFGSTPALRLPDGSVWGPRLGSGYQGTPEPLIPTILPEGGWPNYASRLVFPPVGSAIEELTLLIPVLDTMPSGAAPENWALRFRLVPASPDLTVAPLAVLTTPTHPPGSTPPAGTGTRLPELSSVASRGGVTFTLESVIELTDGYVLTGHLSWEDSAFPAGEASVGMPIPTLTDAANQPIPLEEVLLDAVMGEHSIPWSYRTNRKLFVGPLTLSLAAIEALVIAPPVEFDHDLGPEPRFGQTWQVNRDFEFLGHTVRLRSLRLVASPDSCWGSVLEFRFETDVQGVALGVEDVLPSPPCVPGHGGGGGGGAGEPGVVTTGVVYQGLPSGVHRFRLRAGVPMVVAGPWQVAWQPPPAAGPTPTPEPPACLTEETWRRLLELEAPLPASVGGQFLVSLDAGPPTDATPATGFPEIQVRAVDGTGGGLVGRGGWPALSPDGSRLLYTDALGLHLLDLGSGQDRLLDADGYAPLWSPDGTRILFAASPGLRVMRSDGSGAEQVEVGAAELVVPVGWLPDNQTVVYSRMVAEGFAFAYRNLQSGRTVELFSVRSKWGAGAVAPDGERIAFLDRVFGSGYGVFVARLDGSSRRLVAAPGIPASSRLHWSPDGSWLLISTLDYRPSDIVPAYRPVLIEAATCRPIGALADVGGDIETWTR